MFGWIRSIGQRRHLQEVAHILEAENTRLREEHDRVSRQVDACQQILAVLVEATDKAEAIFERSRAGEEPR